MDPYEKRIIPQYVLNKPGPTLISSTPGPYYQLNDPFSASSRIPPGLKIVTPPSLIKK